MQNLQNETLVLIIAAMLGLNGILLIAFLIQKIRAKRYQNIAYAWAREALTICFDFIYHEEKRGKQHHQLSRKFDQDFEDQL
jgi:hypothetical protein